MLGWHGESCNGTVPLSDPDDTAILRGCLAIWPLHLLPLRSLHRPPRRLVEDICEGFSAFHYFARWFYRTIFIFLGGNILTSVLQAVATSENGGLPTVDSIKKSYLVELAIQYPIVFSAIAIVIIGLGITGFVIDTILTAEERQAAEGAAKEQVLVVQEAVKVTINEALREHDAMNENTVDGARRAEDSMPLAHEADWGEAPELRDFYGRERELDELRQWILDDHAQLVAVFGDLRDPLEFQFNRLTPFEQNIMYWLAIEREPTTLDQPRAAIVPLTMKGKVFEALDSLRRRSMIETAGEHAFTLQPVVMEYVTDRLIERIGQEWSQGTLDVFDQVALTQAQAKDYIRESQARLILTPIAESLTAASGSGGVQAKARALLERLRETRPHQPGYAAGNIFNLLVNIGADMQGYDFSQLAVWQASMQGLTLANINFSHADLTSSVFTDVFGGVLSVACSPDGGIFAAGTTTGAIKLWRLTDGTPLSTLHGHTNWVMSVAFSPDGKLLATGNQDGVAQLWDVATGRLLRPLQGHNDRVWRVAFSPDGTLLASGGEDHTIRLWEVATGRCISTMLGHETRVWSVAFTPSGDVLVSGSQDKSVRLWDVSTGLCLRTFQGHEDPVRDVAYHPDGALIASCGDAPLVRLWDAQTGKTRRGLEGHTQRVESVAFSPDRRLLASGGYDLTARIWDVATGKGVSVLRGHTDWIWSVAFSPDSATLITGSSDQTIRLWDVGAAQSLHTLHGRSGIVWSVACSPNGRLLASGSDDKTIRIWDARDGQNLRTLHGHTERISSVAFAPDGETLASAAADHTVRMWNVEMGDMRFTLQGHAQPVLSVAFSPNGRLLASGSEDETIRLWDTLTGVEGAILHGHTNPVTSVAFSPDGQTLVSGSEDGTIKLWTVATETLAATLLGARPYEQMNITGAQGITEAQRATLLALGASEQ